MEFVATSPARVAFARAELPTRLLEPVADQVGFRRHAAVVGREHPRDVVLTQMRNQQLAAQKRRVADHDVGRRPGRFGAVGRQDRVSALDGVQRLEDRVARLREAVAPHPLEFADPDRHPGELGRVGIDLDALDVGRADLRKRALQAQRLRLELHAMLEVLERLQREVEEIARAAGRVEHREPAQPVEKRPVPPLGFLSPLRARGWRLGSFRALELGGDLGLLDSPLGEQRSDHHRLDQQHDLVPVRVVRAELGALAGIEAALEQRSEDRRVDLRPVQVRCRQHRLDVGPLQRQRVGVVEEPAVEPGHRLEADPAAEGHHPEELAGEFAELGRCRLCVAQHPREHVVRQQADVVGEHAEDEPVDEVRDRLRVVAAIAKRLRHRRERCRGALGERLPGLPRPQPIGT